MKRREFCGISAAAGAATLVPVGRLFPAPADASQGAELRAVKLSGAETTIERAAVRDLRASLSGTLLAPGDEGYELARHIWNGMIDKRPALIARCADTRDIVRAVTFARERELLLAVRGGGHSFPGYSTCDGGLVIVELPRCTNPVRHACSESDAHVPEGWFRSRVLLGPHRAARRRVPARQRNEHLLPKRQRRGC